MYVKPKYGKHWKQLNRHQQKQAMLDIIYELKLEFADIKYQFKSQHGQEVENAGGFFPWYFKLLFKTYKSKIKIKEKNVR